MTWFVLALVAPFVYAVTNYIDRILLDKYFKVSGIGTLIIFSSLLSILILPIILFVEPTVLDVSGYNMFILTLSGILDFGLIWFYLHAMENDDPSVCIIFYQLVPVMALILGYLFLGEVVTFDQFVAMLIIIVGTTFVSFEIDEANKFKPRTKTIIYMSGAAFCWACGAVLFKVAALEENVWRSLFWENLVLVVIGILLFLFVSSYRKYFLETFKTNSASVLSLNVLNESLYITGNAIVGFAVMLAPVALILLGNSFQNIFVLLIGVFLTLFFPKLYSEKISKRHIVQKVFAIIITGIGTYFLLM